MTKPKKIKVTGKVGKAIPVKITKYDPLADILAATVKIQAGQNMVYRQVFWLAAIFGTGLIILGVYLLTAIM